MELHFFAVGNNYNLKYFEDRLNTIPFILPLTRKGKKYEQPVYGNLEEIKLYRYIFPKEYKDSVLKSLEFPKEVDNYAKLTKRTWAIRKAMKLKTIPKPAKDAKPFMLNKDNIGLVPIGIKEDLEGEYGGNVHEGI